MEKTKLILVCDTKNEIDDQFAIAYAHHSPEIELLGVISTQNNRKNGPNSVDIYHSEAVKILNLANSNVLAYKGAGKPFDGMPEKSEGAQFIIKKLQELDRLSSFNSEPPPVVAVTGPATDIINVILTAPEICEKANFIWLGGVKPGIFGRLSRFETNFAGDIAAATKLKQTPNLRLTTIPFLGTSHSLVANTGKMQRQLRRAEKPLHSYLALLIDWNRERKKLNNLSRRPFSNYWLFADLAAIAVAKNIGIKSRINSAHGQIITRINPREIFDDFNKCLGL
ncbi:MAG: nucleoside hydrolase [Candidatus Berkelbacteria bacterium]|nr:nucleoside hydrolase [Candidatus Berkelbacteria bacterium]